MNRVVITGFGAVTPVGVSSGEFWESIKAGRHGFKRIPEIDSVRHKVQYAGVIEGFDPQTHGIAKKDARRMDRYTQFAAAAAKEAMSMSGIDINAVDPFRAGVMIGSGVGGFTTFTGEHEKYLEKGPEKVSVFFVPMMISNMASGMVAMEYGFRGANYTPVSACASGAHAIGEAFRLIKHGYLDVSLAGGSEASIDGLAIAGFYNMGALNAGSDPDRLSIPFDAERAGFVLSEGAAILFLEEYEHARKRGAAVYGEIVGYGATDDAYHITSPDPSGTATAKAMELAVKEAGLTLTDIGYINAHGTSTQLNDEYETNAIKALFLDHAYKLAVSSTKSMTGHMLGAAGAIESIVSILALKEGVLPPTIGYRVRDSACDLDYITEGARKSDTRYALSNSFGFGGHNVTLCFKKV